MTSVATGSVSTGIEGVVSCTSVENTDTNVLRDSTGTVVCREAATGTVAGKMATLH